MPCSMIVFEGCKKLCFFFVSLCEFVSLMNIRYHSF